MATFQTRVENLIGSVSSASALSDWLTAGARIIIEHIPHDKALRNCSVETTPTTFAGKRVVEMRDSSLKYFHQVPTELIALARDSSSIHYRTSSSPNPLYAIAGNGEILAAPAASLTGAVLHYIPYPTVSYTAQEITGVDSMYEHGVVLYAAIQARMKQMTDLSATVPDLPTLSLTSEYDKLTNVTTGYIYGVEDIELGQIQLQHIQAKLSKFNEDIQAFSASTQQILARVQAMGEQLKALKQEYNDFMLLHFNIGKEAKQ